MMRRMVLGLGVVWCGLLGACNADPFAENDLMNQKLDLGHLIEKSTRLPLLEETAPRVSPTNMAKYHREYFWRLPENQHGDKELVASLIKAAGDRLTALGAKVDPADFNTEAAGVASPTVENGQFQYEYNHVRGAVAIHLTIFGAGVTTPDYLTVVQAEYR